MANVLALSTKRPGCFSAFSGGDRGVRHTRAVTNRYAICAACQRKFKPKRSDARYCSDACRQAAHRARAKEDELEVEIRRARVRYWRLVAELARARGVKPSVMLTNEAQIVDEHGNVFMYGEHVGRKDPHRAGWTAWGLEAAGPPWSPPPNDPEGR